MAAACRVPPAELAPRRDDKAEGLSRALQRHANDLEQWRAVFSLCVTYARRTRADEALVLGNSGNGRDQRAAEDQQAEIVSSARREAAVSLSARKQVIATEVDQARAELGGRVELLARDISTQVLGRSA